MFSIPGVWLGMGWQLKGCFHIIFFYNLLSTLKYNIILNFKKYNQIIYDTNEYNKREKIIIKNKKWFPIILEFTKI